MFNKASKYSYLAFLPAALLVLAGYWSIRIAEADRSARTGTPLSAGRAIALAPGDSEYHILLADLLDMQGPSSRRLLQTAVSLNPANASAWIRLGLDSEMKNDLAGAEMCLLRAAQVSAQYEPRWTLANYYFRRGQPEQFWTWTRLALAMSHGDRRPVFDLCWKVTQDGRTILERGIPDQQPVRHEYLAYLLAQGQLDAATSLAVRMLPGALPADLQLLVECGNALLRDRRDEAALQLWNGLCERKLLAYPALAPQAGRSLTNGDFRRNFATGGFDWQAPRMAGLAGVRGTGFFQVSFSGKQPENCDILWQHVPLVPGRKYRLAFEYRTEDIPQSSGLQWTVLDGDGARDPSAASSQLSSREWKETCFVFKAPPGHPARLVLSYRRAPGTVRFEGGLWLRAMHMGFEP